MNTLGFDSGPQGTHRRNHEGQKSNGASGLTAQILKKQQKPEHDEHMLTQESPLAGPTGRQNECELGPQRLHDAGRWILYHQFHHATERMNEEVNKANNIDSREGSLSRVAINKIYYLNSPIFCRTPDVQRKRSIWTGKGAAQKLSLRWPMGSQRLL